MSTQIKKSLRVTVLSPVIIIPFKQNFDTSAQCWVLKTGDIIAQTINKQSTGLDIKDQVFEYYELILNKANLVYYPSIVGLRGNIDEGTFKLVDDINLRVSLDILRGEVQNILVEES